ncbi:MAG: hypothetical protein P4M05_33515 [Bradyrhizobium sp.]|nr:hypothetical protein [Bradyrhizobium sp.]
MLKEAGHLLERSSIYGEDGGFGGLTLEDLHRDASKYELPPGVPEGVQRSFDAARHTYIYSYFSYDLLTPATSQLFACLELALRARLGYSAADKSNMATLFVMLDEAKKRTLTRSDGNGLHKLRNVFQHGTESIIDPNVFLSLLEEISSLICDLFDPNRDSVALPEIEGEPMTRKDRLRRVAIICADFARNLAYYRVGQSQSGSAFHDPSHPQASFWRQANANFLDLAVLEWCKILGERKGKHYWRRIVSDPRGFEEKMLLHLGMKAGEFSRVVETMREYRDTFVAHLDSSRIMNIPTLSAAHAAVCFYHEYVITHEALAGELEGLPHATPGNLSSGYAQCLAEAEQVYRSA